MSTACNLRALLLAEKLPFDDVNFADFDLDEELDECEIQPMLVTIREIKRNNRKAKTALLRLKTVSLREQVVIAQQHCNLVITEEGVDFLVNNNILIGNKKFVCICGLEKNTVRALIGHVCDKAIRGLDYNTACSAGIVPFFGKSGEGTESYSANVSPYQTPTVSNYSECSTLSSRILQLDGLDVNSGSSEPEQSPQDVNMPVLSNVEQLLTNEMEEKPQDVSMSVLSNVEQVLNNEAEQPTSEFTIDFSRSHSQDSTPVKQEAQTPASNESTDAQNLKSEPVEEVFYEASSTLADEMPETAEIIKQELPGGETTEQLKQAVVVLTDICKQQNAVLPSEGEQAVENEDQVSDSDSGLPTPNENVLELTTTEINDSIAVEKSMKRNKRGRRGGARRNKRAEEVVESTTTSVEVCEDDNSEKQDLSKSQKRKQKKRSKKRAGACIDDNIENQGDASSLFLKSGSAKRSRGILAGNQYSVLSDASDDYSSDASGERPLVIDEGPSQEEEVETPHQAVIAPQVVEQAQVPRKVTEFVKIAPKGQTNEEKNTPKLTEEEFPILQTTVPVGNLMPMFRPLAPAPTHGFERVVYDRDREVYQRYKAIGRSFAHYEYPRSVEEEKQIQESLEKTMVNRGSIPAEVFALSYLEDSRKQLREQEMRTSTVAAVGSGSWGMTAENTTYLCYYEAFRALLREVPKCKVEPEAEDPCPCIGLISTNRYCWAWCVQKLGLPIDQNNCINDLQAMYVLECPTMRENFSMEVRETMRCICRFEQRVAEYGHIDVPRNGGVAEVLYKIHKGFKDDHNGHEMVHEHKLLNRPRYIWATVTTKKNKKIHNETTLAKCRYAIVGRSFYGRNHYTWRMGFDAERDAGMCTSSVIFRAKTTDEPKFFTIANASKEEHILNIFGDTTPVVPMSIPDVSEINDGDSNESIPIPAAVETFGVTGGAFPVENTTSDEVVSSAECSDEIVSTQEQEVSKDQVETSDTQTHETYVVQTTLAEDDSAIVHCAVETVSDPVIVEEPANVVVGCVSGESFGSTDNDEQNTSAQTAAKLLAAAKAYFKNVTEEVTGNVEEVSSVMMTTAEDFKVPAAPERYVPAVETPPVPLVVTQIPPSPAVLVPEVVTQIPPSPAVHMDDEDVQEDVPANFRSANTTPPPETSEPEEMEEETQPESTQMESDNTISEEPVQQYTENVMETEEEVCDPDTQETDMTPDSWADQFEEPDTALVLTEEEIIAKNDKLFAACAEKPWNGSGRSRQTKRLPVMHDLREPPKYMDYTATMEPKFVEWAEEFLKENTSAYKEFKLEKQDKNTESYYVDSFTYSPTYAGKYGHLPTSEFELCSRIDDVMSQIAQGKVPRYVLTLDEVDDIKVICDSDSCYEAGILKIAIAKISYFNCFEKARKALLFPQLHPKELTVLFKNHHYLKGLATTNTIMSRILFASPHLCMHTYPNTGQELSHLAFSGWYFLNNSFYCACGCSTMYDDKEYKPEHFNMHSLVNRVPLTCNGVVYAKTSGYALAPTAQKGEGIHPLTGWVGLSTLDECSTTVYNSVTMYNMIHQSGNHNAISHLDVDYCTLADFVVYGTPITYSGRVYVNDYIRSEVPFVFGGKNALNCEGADYFCNKNIQKGSCLLWGGVKYITLGNAKELVQPDKLDVLKTWLDCPYTVGEPTLICLVNKGITYSQTEQTCNFLYQGNQYTTILTGQRDFEEKHNERWVTYVKKHVPYHCMTNSADTYGIRYRLDSTPLSRQQIRIKEIIQGITVPKSKPVASAASVNASGNNISFSAAASTISNENYYVTVLKNIQALNGLNASEENSAGHLYKMLLEVVENSTKTQMEYSPMDCAIAVQIGESLHKLGAVQADKYMALNDTIKDLFGMMQLHLNSNPGYMPKNVQGQQKLKVLLMSINMHIANYEFYATKQFIAYDIVDIVYGSHSVATIQGKRDRCQKANITKTYISSRPGGVETVLNGRVAYVYSAPRAGTVLMNHYGPVGPTMVKADLVFVGGSFTYFANATDKLSAFTISVIKTLAFKDCVITEMEKQSTVEDTTSLEENAEQVRKASDRQVAKNHRESGITSYSAEEIGMFKFLTKLVKARVPFGTRNVPKVISIKLFTNGRVEEDDLILNNVKPDRERKEGRTTYNYQNVPIIYVGPMVGYLKSLPGVGKIQMMLKTVHTKNTSFHSVDKTRVKDVTKEQLEETMNYKLTYNDMRFVNTLGLLLGFIIREDSGIVYRAHQYLVAEGQLPYEPLGFETQASFEKTLERLAQYLHSNISGYELLFSTVPKDLITKDVAWRGDAEKFDTSEYFMTKAGVNVAFREIVRGLKMVKSMEGTNHIPIHQLVQKVKLVVHEGSANVYCNFTTIHYVLNNISEFKAIGVNYLNIVLSSQAFNPFMTGRVLSTILCTHGKVRLNVNRADTIVTPELEAYAQKVEKEGINSDLLFDLKDLFTLETSRLEIDGAQWMPLTIKGYNKFSECKAYNKTGHGINQISKNLWQVVDTTKKTAFSSNGKSILALMPCVFYDIKLDGRAPVITATAAKKISEEEMVNNAKATQNNFDMATCKAFTEFDTVPEDVKDSSYVAWSVKNKIFSHIGVANPRGSTLAARVGVEEIYTSVMVGRNATPSKVLDRLTCFVRNGVGSLCYTKKNKPMSGIYALTKSGGNYDVPADFVSRQLYSCGTVYVVYTRRETETPQQQAQQNRRPAPKVMKSSFGVVRISTKPSESAFKPKVDMSQVQPNAELGQTVHARYGGQGDFVELENKSKGAYSILLQKISTPEQFAMLNTLILSVPMDCQQSVIVSQFVPLL